MKTVIIAAIAAMLATFVIMAARRSRRARHRLGIGKTMRWQFIDPLDETDL